jgi:hypothetical protein
VIYDGIETFALPGGVMAMPFFWVFANAVETLRKP